METDLLLNDETKKMCLNASGRWTTQGFLKGARTLKYDLTSVKYDLTAVC